MYDKTLETHIDTTLNALQKALYACDNEQHKTEITKAIIALTECRYIFSESQS